MKTLLLIPSVLKTVQQEEVAADRHPRMDYYALADGLRAAPDGFADFLDHGAVDACANPLVRLVRRAAGRDAALALMGFLRRRDYAAIFSNGENVALPLALLLKFVPQRPGHVTIGHRLSTGKKRIFYTLLKAHRQMDTIFVYATTQKECAECELGIPSSKLALIPFHADAHFYRPRPTPPDSRTLSAAGLEWRDYPTLIEAMRSLPSLSLKLAAASPWSKHANETENRDLPPNVDARRYEYAALRELYAESLFVVVPLYENDFQAGITTILEAMAMGKAVIVSRTTGQTDVIVHGENGWLVERSDPDAMREAIVRLESDPELRERLGHNARRWLEAHATLDLWVERVVAALRAFDPNPSRHRSAEHAAADLEAQAA